MLISTTVSTLRRLLVQYDEEAVDADNALRWISQVVGDASNGSYPLPPPDETPVLLDASYMKKPTLIRKPRYASQKHVNARSFSHDKPLCYLCESSSDFYDPARYRVCGDCRSKLHSISRAFGLGSEIRLDEEEDGTGLRLMLSNKVEDTAQAIIHGMALRKAKEPDQYPCEKCGEQVGADEFCGNDKADGTSEFLCSDCYVPDPSGLFVAGGK